MKLNEFIKVDSNESAAPKEEHPGPDSLHIDASNAVFEVGEGESYVRPHKHIACYLRVNGEIFKVTSDAIIIIKSGSVHDMVFNTTHNK